MSDHSRMNGETDERFPFVEASEPTSRSTDVREPETSTNVVASSQLSHSSTSSSIELQHNGIEEEEDDDYTRRIMRRLGLELTYSDNAHHKFAVRPGFGKSGGKINLIANYFSINLPQGMIFHYDIDIDRVPVQQIENAGRDEEDKRDGVDEGEKQETDVCNSNQKKIPKKYKCLSTRIKRNIVETMIQEQYMFRDIRPAFDGEKNLYTRTPLPIISEKTFCVLVSGEYGRVTNYKIKIKPVNKKDDTGRMVGNAISLEPLFQLFRGNCHDITPEILTGVMAVETILRHGPALRLVPIGRSFFEKPRIEKSLSEGREIWFGHHQSIQLTQFGARLNIDKSATVFYKGGPVIDFMIDKLYPWKKQEALRSIRNLTKEQRETLEIELKGLRITVTHLPYPRKYRISGITEESANHIYFEMEVNGRKNMISVSQYFKNRYQRLQHPNLPCIMAGSEMKRIYLPFEVCRINEGQHCNKKLSPEATKAMIKETICSPKQRFSEIQESLKAVMRDLDPFYREFGISINPELLKVPGRKLDPPSIIYENEKFSPLNGRWNMKDKKFYSGVNINKWLLLDFSKRCNREQLENFIEIIRKVGQNGGMNFFPPLHTRSIVDECPERILQRAKRIEPDLQLILVILPDKMKENKEIYSKIKTVAETELGVLTQCVKCCNIIGEKSKITSVLSNICMKINTKLGGVNNSFALETKPDILKKRFMVIGADCCHSSTTENIGYSFAAVAGSMDKFPSKYMAVSRAQKPKTLRDGSKMGQEVIVNLREMVVELLNEFIAKNHRAPEKIIFYRDGVSRGEFQKVIVYELEQIRKACEEKKFREKVSITFIIVEKRHHTRFAPGDAKDGVGKWGNIPPGTTVDTHVTHPVLYDFYLCSHEGIQGTSRPAHYTVLLDENNLSADDVQYMTYYLCYAYANCTRSVSIPCAVMYADSAAFRAKLYFARKNGEMHNSNSDARENQDSFVAECITVKHDLHNAMYFI